MYKVYAILFLLLVGCKSDMDKGEGGQSDTDFITFYEKFHIDTSYQMAHIDFPLEGSPAQLDTLIVTDIPFYWEKKDWAPHKPYDSNSEFERTITKISDDFYIEKFTHRQFPVEMERRFARKKDGWRLIYYSEPQPK